MKSAHIAVVLFASALGAGVAVIFLVAIAAGVFVWLAARRNPVNSSNVNDEWPERGRSMPKKLEPVA